MQSRRTFIFSRSLVAFMYAPQTVTKNNIKAQPVLCIRDVSSRFEPKIIINLIKKSTFSNKMCAFFCVQELLQH